MYKNANTGYEKVSTFKEKVFCLSLSIYAFIMKTLYDRPSNTFHTFKSANEGLKKYIAEYVYRQVKKIIDEDFSTIKIPPLTWDKKGKKEENQNILDSLLKPCLPLMWNYIDVFQDRYNSTTNNNEEFLKFIPDGQEAAAQIVLKNGQIIEVYKSNDQMKYECISCQKGICSTIEVILDGEVKEELSFFAGKYKKKTNLCNGKSQWIQITDENEAIWYNQDKNVWVIGCADNGVITTLQDGPCPTVDFITFQYWNRSESAWNPASVIIKCV